MYENDGKFPVDSRVEVLYPLDPWNVGERDEWLWMPGVIDEQCGPDEWRVCVMDRRVRMLKDGRKPRKNTPSRNLFYPVVFRDSSEIRPQRSNIGAGELSDVARNV